MIPPRPQFRSIIVGGVLWTHQSSSELRPCLTLVDKHQTSSWVRLRNIKNHQDVCVSPGSCLWRSGWKSGRENTWPRRTIWAWRNGWQVTGRNCIWGVASWGERRCWRMSLLTVGMWRLSTTLRMENKERGLFTQTKKLIGLKQIWKPEEITHKSD